MFYHQRDSIAAHLTVVFAALAVARHLRDATGISISKLVQTLRPLRTVTIDVNGHELTAAPAITSDAQDILDSVSRNLRNKSGTSQDLAVDQHRHERVAHRPTGAGKTHLAVALARAAAAAGYRTYFTSAADLAAWHHKAALDGRWSTTMRYFAGPPLLVIDEIGYLTLPAEVSSTLFQVMKQR